MLNSSVERAAVAARTVSCSLRSGRSVKRRWSRLALLAMAGTALSSPVWATPAPLDHLILSGDYIKVGIND